MQEVVRLHFLSCVSIQQTKLGEESFDIRCGWQRRTQVLLICIVSIKMNTTNSDIAGIYIIM